MKWSVTWSHGQLPEYTEVGSQWPCITGRITLYPSCGRWDIILRQTHKNVEDNDSLSLEKRTPGHAYPLSLPFVQLHIEKKRKQTFITPQNCGKSFAGCFIYVISLILAKTLCSRDFFDRCSNWNPEQLKRWLQVSVGLFKGRIHPQFVCVPRDCASNHTSLPPGKSRGKHFPALPCIYNIS